MDPRVLALPIAPSKAAAVRTFEFVCCCCCWVKLGVEGDVVVKFRKGSKSAATANRATGDMLDPAVVLVLVPAATVKVLLHDAETGDVRELGGVRSFGMFVVVVVIGSSLQDTDADAVVELIAPTLFKGEEEEAATTVVEAVGNREAAASDALIGEELARLAACGYRHVFR